MQSDLESMARKLEDTGEYKIVRKYHKTDVYAAPDGAATQLGLILDTETTGLEVFMNEVIELGMILFEYAPATGRIYRIVETFDEFRDPGRPIPPEVTKLTGITDEMVHGCLIDESAVESFVSRASVIIAHNAEFDRPFVEKHWKAFRTKPWGCSMRHIPWYDEGIATQKLELIALCQGFFYDAHRALDDSLALLHTLTCTLPASGRPALKPLLDRAMSDDVRIWAIDAPYSTKDLLKARRYQWNDGSNGLPKAWHTSIAVGEFQAEMQFLNNDIYEGNAKNRVKAERIPPEKRFSSEK
jgi:DNA polymerase-3 subunit epsilon